MLVLVLNLVGLVGLVIGVRAFIQNRRDARRTSRLSLVRVAALAFGVLLAAASTLFMYPLGANTTVIGLPFTAAVFENGADFVGPLTAPAYVANAAFWSLCPQFILRLSRWRAGKTTVR